MKQILCFGDSNTWGHDPCNDGKRFSFDKRWTGIVTKYLGDGFSVQEEGLCGRTTVFEDPFDPYLCSKDSLPVILRTHCPIDLVILMLGTNDIKQYFHADISAITQGIETLLQMIQKPEFSQGYPVAQILLISPILIGEQIADSPFGELFDGRHAYQLSLKLAKAYQKTAQKFHCHFLNAAEYARPSAKDCLHLDSAGHAALAKAIGAEVKRIFPKI